MGNWARIHQRFGKNSNEVTNDKFIKFINLAKKPIKVWQKIKQDDKRGMSIIVGFTKMTYFAKLANLAKDSLKVWQKI